MEKFLDYSTGDAAVWIRVAFTIDRFIAVLFPLYAGRCCGRASAARGHVVFTVAAALLKNFHIFWTCGAEYRTTYVCGAAINGSSDGTSLVTTTTVENCAFPEPYKVCYGIV